MLRSRSQQLSASDRRLLRQLTTPKLHRRSLCSRPSFRVSPHLLGLSRCCYSASIRKPSIPQPSLAGCHRPRGSAGSPRHYATSTLSSTDSQPRSGLLPHSPASYLRPSSLEDRQQPIRTHLEQWQLQNGTPNATDDVLDTFPLLRKDDSNPMTSWSPIAIKRDMQQDDMDDNEEESESDMGQESETSELALSAKSGHMHLNPGDLILVETSAMSANRPEFAIYTNQLSQNLFQCIDRDNRWIQLTPSRVREVAVRNFISPKLVDRVVPFLPTKQVSPEVSEEIRGLYSDVPRDVTAPLLEAMRAFEHAVDEVYRANSEALDRIWEKLAHPTKVRKLTVQNITKFVFARIEPQEHHTVAVLYALFGSGLKVSYSRTTFVFTKRFTIRSKRDIEGLYQVREWGRQYREHLSTLARGDGSLPPSGVAEGVQIITAFAEKARRLIARSRQTRMPVPRSQWLGSYRSGNQNSPSEQPGLIEEGESFDPNQKKILQLLEEYAVSRRLWREIQLKATVATIVSALGDYQSELALNMGTDDPLAIHEGVVTTLLQELGVLMPFGNQYIFDEYLELPMTGTIPEIDNMYGQAYESTFDNSQDPLAHLRRDYKDLTIFCIDPDHTVIVDDGISLEQAGHPSSGQWWVNIHIANPTAFADKNHIVSKLARHLGVKVSIPEGTFNMLPAQLCDMASLGENKPCLTFSARVDVEGNILEHRVEAGIVRNVVFLSPSTASECFGKVAEVGRNQRRHGAIRTRLAVGTPKSGTDQGGAALGRKKLEDLNPQQTEGLENIARIAHALLRARNARSAWRPAWINQRLQNAHNPHVSVDWPFYRAPIDYFGSGPRSGLKMSRPSQSRARYFNGDPTIAYEFDQPADWSYWVPRAVDDKLDPIEECMLLAQHVAGSWLSERRVPAIYQTLADMRQGDEFAEMFHREVVNKFKATDESIPFPISKIVSRLNPLGAFTLQSGQVNLAGYRNVVKVTSPLRSYLDLLSHWQIQAALKAEAEGNGQKVLIGDPLSPLSADQLPFSATELEHNFMELSARNVEVRSGVHQLKLAWLATLFRRAHMLGEGNFPKTYTMSMDRLHHTAGIWVGQLIDILIPARLDPSVPGDQSNGDIQPGDLWEVAFYSIRGMQIMFRAVRLIERSPVDLRPIISHLR